MNVGAIAAIGMFLARTTDGTMPVIYRKISMALVLRMRNSDYGILFFPSLNGVAEYLLLFLASAFNNATTKVLVLLL